MRLDEIKPGKTYTNKSIDKEIHRWVEGITNGRVYFIVKKSPYTSGWNAVGKRDWVSLKSFASWAKCEVTT